MNIVESIHSQRSLLLRSALPAALRAWALVAGPALLVLFILAWVMAVQHDSAGAVAGYGATLGVPAFLLLALVPYVPIALMGAVLGRSASRRCAPDQPDSIQSTAAGSGLVTGIGFLLCYPIMAFGLALLMATLFVCLGEQHPELRENVQGGLIWIKGLLGGAEIGLAGLAIAMPVLKLTLIKTVTGAVVALGVGALAATLLRHERRVNAGADLSDPQLKQLAGVAGLIRANLMFEIALGDAVIFGLCIAGALWQSQPATKIRAIRLATLLAVAVSMVWYSFFDLGYLVMLLIAYLASGSAAIRMRAALLPQAAKDPLPSTLSAQAV